MKKNISQFENTRFLFALTVIGLLLFPGVTFAAIQNLNGLNGSSQTFANDTNVKITSSGTVHTLGWIGALPVARGGTGTNSFTAGSLLFSNGTLITQDNSGLFWDDNVNLLKLGGNASISNSFEVGSDLFVVDSGGIFSTIPFETTSYTSSSALFGSSLSNCGVSGKLQWNPGGVFTCVTDQIGGSSAWLGLGVDAGGASIHVTDLSFDTNSFDFINIASQGFIKLDYTNGPASRSATNTWTALNTFNASPLALQVTGNAQISANVEIGGYATASETFGSGLVDCGNTVTSKLLWANGKFSCGVDQTSGGGGGVSLDGNNTWTGFNDFTAYASVSPKLEINNNSGTASLEILSAGQNDKRFIIQSNGTGSADRLSILNNLNTELFTVASNGFVGIGSNSPTSILNLRGSDPILTIRDTSAGGRTYQLRNGISAGDFDIFDPVAKQTRLLIQEDGNISIGSASNPNNNSRMFVYGGNNGANIDVRGTSTNFQDQAVIELEGNQYDTDVNSVRLQYYGANNSAGTTAGFPNQNLGVLAWQRSTGPVTALIAVQTDDPLIFATNNTERMRLDGTKGYLGIGTTSPDSSLEIASASAKLTIRSNGSASPASIDFVPDGGSSSSKFSIVAGSLGGSNEKLNILNGVGTTLFSIASNGNVEIGAPTKPGCMIIGDSDGSGVTYVTANDGVLSASTVKPSACE